jgi:hypothetical protein
MSGVTTGDRSKGVEVRERFPFAVTILWLLVPGLCASQASDPCADVRDLDALQAAEILKAEDDFKALGFGGGYGMVASFGGRTRVKEAELVAEKVRVTKEEGVQFGPMLELHKFVWPLMQKKVEKFSDQKYRLVPGRTSAAGCPRASVTLTDTVPITLIAFGPFIGLRLGTEDVVESFGGGVMFGFRKAEKDDVSLNVGIALMTDPNARTLGDGIEEGKALPPGETVIRYKTGHREGWSLLFSVGW